LVSINLIIRTLFLDEAAENNEAFDYMNLMEQQYYTLSFPAFDPTMYMKGAIPGPVTAPNYMHMVPNMNQFRAPIVPTVPPPSTVNISNIPHSNLQAAAQAAMEKRFRNVKLNGPQIPSQQMAQPSPVSIQNSSRPTQQPVSSQSQQSPQIQTTNAESRPDSVASSLTSTIPPTPTNLLSPNPNIPPMQPMPFNPLTAPIPGPMPVVQNPQMMYPFMTPFSSYVPMQQVAEVPADVMKDALCKQM
jgi:hypothetical protein